MDLWQPDIINMTTIEGNTTKAKRKGNMKVRVDIKKEIQKQNKYKHASCSNPLDHVATQPLALDLKFSGAYCLFRIIPINIHNDIISSHISAMYFNYHIISSFLDMFLDVSPILVLHL